VNARRCDTCAFYVPGATRFTGRCLHPARQLPVGFQPWVRDRELPCRLTWDRDLWEARSQADDRVIAIRVADPDGAPAAAPRRVPVEDAPPPGDRALVWLTEERPTPAAPPWPTVPRLCGTCRSFRADGDGQQGWCANTWAFPRPRRVSAALLACRSTLGSWWLPADAELVSRQ
jgi:hypothetical protein